MTRRSIIIDTDPSPDDGAAILTALGSPDELEVLAVTTVGGNLPLERTTRNALTVLDLVGRADVPVHAGAAGPLMRRLETAEHVNGRTGLDGYDLPEPGRDASPGFAPDAIVDLVMERPPGTVTLCCLAPLTNIALAMIREPSLAARLAGIVLMGGARSQGGNVTPAAEYNIYVDPEAAEVVLGSGAPVTMIPLDCTHKALTTRARMERLRAVGQPHTEAFYHLLRFNKSFNERQDGTDGGPLHDPTVIARLLKPELFEGRHVHVAVSRDALTRGMTVIDWRRVTRNAPNATVLTEIDAEGYFDLVIERLARAAR